MEQVVAVMDVPANVIWIDKENMVLLVGKIPGVIMEQVVAVMDVLLDDQSVMMILRTVTQDGDEPLDIGSSLA